MRVGRYESEGRCRGACFLVIKQGNEFGLLDGESPRHGPVMKARRRPRIREYRGDADLIVSRRTEAKERYR